MAGRLTAPRAGRRRAALLALAAVVLVVHGWVTSAVADRMSDFSAAPNMPHRIEVAYVRELVPAAPPVLAAAPAAVSPPLPAAARARRRPRPAEPPASAALPDAPPVISDPTALLAQAAEPVLEARAEPTAEIASAAAADAAASATVAAPAASAPDASNAAVPATTALAAAPASAAASGAEPFEWPVSTRLSYRLTGYYRGDVEGDAQVEWVRSGARYQVHLDFTIGPPFAPLITRRMSSDGDITPTGLAPRRYDQDTKIVFRDRQRLTLLFEPDEVVLANGERRQSTAGVQDTASQFVQLSYLFTTQPELLRPGASIDVPLALPRKVERWTYDVLAQETLATPVGDLDTYHLKPRRSVTATAGDLVAEIWFAPTLRYLPVRIRIQQDAQTFIDLLIARRPEIAAP